MHCSAYNDTPGDQCKKANLKCSGQCNCQSDRWPSTVVFFKKKTHTKKKHGDSRFTHEHTLSDCLAFVWVFVKRWQTIRDTSTDSFWLTLKMCMYVLISVRLAGRLFICGKSVNVAIFSDAIKMDDFKICKVVVFIELYPFIPLSVTLIVFQGHSTVKQF